MGFTCRAAKKKELPASYVLLRWRAGAVLLFHLNRQDELPSRRRERKRSRPTPAQVVKPRKRWYNDHQMAKSIENSIDFAAKRQVWQRMIPRIIRMMFIAMIIGQNSHAVLLRRKTTRRKTPSFFAIFSSL